MSWASWSEFWLGSGEVPDTCFYVAATCVERGGLLCPGSQGAAGGFLGFTVSGQQLSLFGGLPVGSWKHSACRQRGEVPGDPCTPLQGTLNLWLPSKLRKPSSLASDQDDSELYPTLHCSPEDSSEAASMGLCLKSPPRLTPPSPVLPTPPPFRFPLGALVDESIT